MCIKGKNTPILYKESNELIRPDLYILPVNGGYTVFNLNVVYDARSVRFEQMKPVDYLNSILKFIGNILDALNSYNNHKT